MPDLRVTSWDELIQQLYAESWKPALGRFRSNFAFRGMQWAGKDLTTSLCRLAGEYVRNEQHLLRNFRKYAHREAAGGESVWNWLSLAQHHGLPTRLLDWTFSPFVALHFVTQEVERFDVDGAVWCVDYVKSHRFLPDALRQILRDEQADVFTTEMLDRAADTLGKLDGLSDGSHGGSDGGSHGGDRGEPFVVFLDPPSLDDRITNQFALLSLMSSPLLQMHEWLYRRPELWRRLIVPAELKWEVRDKLDQANITERVLFPGLDGLSRWLKRYYSPRGKPPAPDDAYDEAKKESAGREE